MQVCLKLVYLPAIGGKYPARLTVSEQLRRPLCCFFSTFLCDRVYCEIRGSMKQPASPTIIVFLLYSLLRFDDGHKICPILNSVSFIPNTLRVLSMTDLCVTLETETDSISELNSSPCTWMLTPTIPTRGNKMNKTCCMVSAMTVATYFTLVCFTVDDLLQL